MKKQLLLLVMPLLSIVTSAHDIKVANDDGVTIYYNYNNDSTELTVTYYGNKPFLYSFYRGTVVIPEEVTYMNKTLSVTSIGRGAFRDCNVITSITIPSSVTRIDEEAFSGCVSLTLVTSLNATPPSIYSSTFNNYSATLQVPTGSKTDYQNAKYWKNFTNVMEIDPTGVQSITLDKNNNAPIYDLNGRKLKEPSKGINIIGGKKVMVK